MKSAAVVNYDNKPHSVEIREVDRPVCGDDDVIIEVKAASVCGSDIHQWEAKQSWTVKYPVILGHEFGGVIVETGKNVLAWKEGDRVVSETAAHVDMFGPMSRQGLYNLDPSRKGFGALMDGAMTKYAKVAQRLLHKVPDSVEFKYAAMTEPCSVAYSATIDPGLLKLGDRIAVLGPGPIGILSAIMAKLGGAEVALVGLERDKPRLEIAKKYGIEVVFNSPVEWARATDGLGCDGIVDATGVSVALQGALEAIRPNGWISKVGWGPQPLNFSLDPLVQKNVRLQGSFSHNWPMWEKVLRMLDTKQLDLTPILGGVYPIDQWQTAFEKMHSGEYIKSVITPA
jgi:alcohol dehydrogenase/L-iditol 2-dehydrogenase